MSQPPAGRALFWAAAALALAALVVLVFPGRFGLMPGRHRLPKDAVYLHHCRRRPPPERAMLVIAKQGEAVVCPICSVQVTDGVPEARSVTHWTDPMVPGLAAPSPGRSPTGARMVPVFAEQAPADGQAPEAGYPDVLVTPNKQLLMGLATAEASPRSLRKTIPTEAALVHHGRPHEPAWINARLTDEEARLVRSGQGVFVEVPALREHLRGAVRAIEPLADERERVLRIRADLDDPERVPHDVDDVRVVVNVDFGERLSVPAGAITKAGEKRFVFVDRGRGVFEPREVTLGVEADSFSEILSGLTHGERVMSRGHFLIDAESPLSPALSGLAQEPQATP